MTISFWVLFRNLLVGGQVSEMMQARLKLVKICKLCENFYTGTKIISQNAPQVLHNIVCVHAFQVELGHFLGLNFIFFVHFGT